MATEKQTAELRKFGIRAGHIREMDSEIIPVVIDLNRNGFTTTESCAGHKGGMGGERGMIFFYPFPNREKREKATEIMKKHGLKNLRINPAKLVITFSRMGKPWKKRG